MSVSTIARYLAREFILASAVVLLGLIMVWVSADSLLHIDEIASETGRALRGVLLRSFDILPQGVPTACAIGVVWSLTRAVRFREITAIRCGGIKLQYVLLPILALSLVIAVSSAALHDRVLIPAQHALAGAVEPDDDSRPRRIGDRWWHVSDGWLFSAEGFTARERTLEDVTVFQLDTSHRVSRRIDAARARYLGEGRWQFESVHDRRFGHDDLLEIQDLPELSLTLGVDLRSVVRRSANGKLAPDAMSLHGLSEAADEVRSPAERQSLLGAFHGRLALPLSVLILVLVAIPIAIGDVERGDSFPRALIQTLAAVTGFWLVWTLARLGSQIESLPPWIPIWGTVLLVTGVATWRFRTITE